MQVVQGLGAESEFRLKQLLGRLQQEEPNIQKVTAHWVYFINSHVPLTSNTLKKLCELLPGGTLVEEQKQKEAAWVVVPRLGTVSPWASKATQLCHNAGFIDIERIERGVLYSITFSKPSSQEAWKKKLYDPMTQCLLTSLKTAEALFHHHAPKELKEIPLLTQGKDALNTANMTLGLALSQEEIDYLHREFSLLERNPTDVELMMFAQANSEHCRHKIFKGQWIMDGKEETDSLFSMIQKTYAHAPEGILSAYKDNASVMEGFKEKRFILNPITHEYAYEEEPIHILMKVETHNHPTAISPYPGAATGSGGELRDEGATGRGAKPKAGLTGFAVSHLHIPGLKEPWETVLEKPAHLRSALDIMIEGPIGAAAYNNEFGRPALAGYFRSFQLTHEGETRGYHKPIMIAGGYGNIRGSHVEKHSLPEKALLIVLGGPGMEIGLGGGAASSMAAGTSDEGLEFASVQRDNAEMQRRAQEVIDACWSLGEKNPILSIHDVGAGGLSNALPEIIHDAKRGGTFQLRNILTAEPGMSPLAIWCNESQERYVLAIQEEDLPLFSEFCLRERCPFSVVGHATLDPLLKVEDKEFQNTPIHLPMSLLFGKTPNGVREGVRSHPSFQNFSTGSLSLSEAISRVLRHPTVASKQFLITIGDRSVGGSVVRDQLVGPWQVPVADVAVTAQGFHSFRGEAMAMGERPPLALIHPAASARMAVAEAITNITAASIKNLSDIKCSANWMAACGSKEENAALFDGVRAASDLCVELGIAIPVGKDSLSMNTQWKDEAGVSHEVKSPLSLVISAFAKVQEVRRTLTPQLSLEGDPHLWFIDLAKGHTRLGGSILAQTWSVLGNEAPDVVSSQELKQFFKGIQTLNEEDLLFAYHDRSDGGLLATVCEMMFASRVGISLDLTALTKDPMAFLFNEELGAVIQFKEKNTTRAMNILEEMGLLEHMVCIGRLQKAEQFEISYEGNILYKNTRSALQKIWSQPSYELQRLRDNPLCADEEYAAIENEKDQGLFAQLTFDVDEEIHAPYVQRNAKPKVAILREQGVNGHLEMAAAFTAAGFLAVDVHMSDILKGEVSFNEFKGMGVCGGFSYGDVLGAGRGWATSILFHEEVKDAFQTFFEDPSHFVLGVCNGCQMLSHLKSIIPGSHHWPQFVRNASEQFEARWALTEIMDSSSILTEGMVGSIIPVMVSHGEGRVLWEEPQEQKHLEGSKKVVMRFVDEKGNATEKFPKNPNGSPRGITAITNTDGRVTLMMPHPERIFRGIQHTWAPTRWKSMSPWFRLFANARRWVD